MPSILAKRRFGQNFLINPGVQARFGTEAQNLLHQNPTLTRIIEIGPGTGAVTEQLIKLKKPITVLEMDPEAVEFLQAQTWAKHIEIVPCDALKVLSEPYDLKNVLIVSNLPFNVGSRILIELSLQQTIAPWVCVLQKEVMSKLLTKQSFGVMSGWMNIFWEYTKVMDISPGSFRPAPNVTSTLVSASPKLLPDFLLDTKIRKSALSWLKKLVAYPSKSLRNNLKNHLDESQMGMLYSDLSLIDTTRVNYDNYLILLEYLTTRLPKSA